jgi:alkaline phosphatase D
MLDSRMYRDYGSTPPSMLGPAQKAWLLQGVAASTATFKVLVSAVPWAFNTKPGSDDPWDGFSEEREEIFSHLEENRIEGVVLLSADRHRSDAWRIVRPNGYDLHDFMSSRLTNTHAHPVMAGSLYGYNQKCSFGKLTFRLSKQDPEVTYEIITIDGEVVYAITLRASELSYPVGSRGRKLVAPVRSNGAGRPGPVRVVNVHGRTMQPHTILRPGAYIVEAGRGSRSAQRRVRVR